MASESVILELIRQAERERNRPGQMEQALAQIPEAMKGVAQGVQLYDMVKSMGVKYGSGAAGGVPGAPQAPVVAGQALPGAAQMPDLSGLTRATSTGMAGTPQPDQPLTAGIAAQPSQVSAGVMTPSSAGRIPGTVDLEAFATLANALKGFTGPGVETALTTEAQRRGINLPGGVRNVYDLKADSAQQLEILRQQAKTKASGELNTDRDTKNLNDRLQLVAKERDNAARIMEQNKFFQNEKGLGTEYKRAQIIFEQKQGEYEAISERLNGLQGIKVRAGDSGTAGTGKTDTFWDQFSH